MIPNELAHRSETALQDRAKRKGWIDRASEKYKRQPGDSKREPAPKPDFLDAAEPRAAVLFIERATDSGSQSARMMLNQLVSVKPSERDALLQSYIDRLTRAGWKPGKMARGGRCGVILTQWWHSGGLNLHDRTRCAALAFASQNVRLRRGRSNGSDKWAQRLSCTPKVVSFGDNTVI